MMPITPRNCLRIFLPLLAAALLLNGCTQPRPQYQPPPKETVKPQPTKPPPQLPQQPQPPPPQPEIPQEAPPLPKETINKEAQPPAQSQTPELKPQKGPASSLYQNAEQALQKGDSARAEMLLERALRIEPRNGWYWNAMGRAKYAQGATDQAIQFWKKSNSLAGKDAELSRANDLLLNKINQNAGETGNK
jgi:predicted Zn-dependent protease